MQRFFELFCRRILLGALLLGLLPAVSAARADDIEIVSAHLEAADDGYKLAASYSFDLNHGLEDAVTKGVTLYFTTEVELTRRRWYWFDETAVATSQTCRLSYNVLTRQFNVAIIGSVQQTFANLEDAMSLIRRPSRWLVAGRGALKGGEVYNVTLQMGLNLEYLPKPYQVNSFNNSDWRLSSNKKHFTYRAEEK